MNIEYDLCKNEYCFWFNPKYSYFSDLIQKISVSPTIIKILTLSLLFDIYVHYGFINVTQMLIIPYRFLCDNKSWYEETARFISTKVYFGRTLVKEFPISFLPVPHGLHLIILGKIHFNLFSYFSNIQLNFFTNNF